MTRLASLLLVAALAACGPRPVAQADAQTALPSTPPTVSILGDGTGSGLLLVAFRDTHKAPLSEVEGAVVRLSGATVEAPLEAGPAMQTEGRNVVVTQASYRLDAAGLASLAKAGTSARLVLVMGETPAEYPFVRADLLE